jgi:hypothetical protein
MSISFRKIQWIVAGADLVLVGAVPFCRSLKRLLPTQEQ